MTPFGGPQVAMSGECRRTRFHNRCVTNPAVGELWDSLWP